MSKTRREKVLLIRFSSIGDIVLTSPVLRCMSEQMDVELHYLTKKTYAPLLAHNPYLHRTHLLDNSISDTIKNLKAESFDFVIDLHKNIRSKKIVTALGRKTYSINKRSVDRWLLVHMKLDRLQGNHIVDRYMSTVHALGVQTDNKGLDLFLPLKQSISYTIPDRYMILVVGTKHLTKNIPITLAREIISSLSILVVLIGGQEHKEMAHAIADGTKAIDLVGQTSLLESAHLIKNSNLVISPDTGMMHIAAALKKPLIAIYGSTASSLGFTPYMPRNEDRYAIIENSSLSCRPCTKMGRNSCPKKHFNCMNDLDCNTIVEKARSFID